MESALQDLINSYDALTLTEKRRELGREIAETIIVLKQILAQQTGLELKEELLKDFNNLYDGTSGESEYLTGLYEDIIDLKETLGLILSKNIFEEYEE